jgi:hypothetical protein
MKATHCWQVDGAWRVGSVAMFDIQVNGKCMPLEFKCDNVTGVIQGDSKYMKNYHTGKIEAVPVAWLRPYPREEIKSP